MGKESRIKQKIDFMKHSESKWKVSRNRRILKIEDLDSNENHRARQEENVRVIEFGYQIIPVGEQHWTSVLGKRNGRKYMVYDVLQSTKESADETEVNNEREEGI